MGKLERQLPENILNEFNKLNDINAEFTPADAANFKQVITQYLNLQPGVGLVSLFKAFESTLSSDIYKTKDCVTRLDAVMVCLENSRHIEAVADLTRRDLIDLALKLVSKMSERMSEYDEEEDEDDDNENQDGVRLLDDGMRLVLNLISYATINQLSALIEQFRAFLKLDDTPIWVEDFPSYDLITEFASKINERSFVESEQQDRNRLMTRFVNIVLSEGKKVANAYPITALTAWTDILGAQQKFILFQDMYSYFKNGPSRNPDASRDFDGVYCVHHMSLFKDCMKFIDDSSYQQVFENVLNGIEKVKLNDPELYNEMHEEYALQSLFMVFLPKLSSNDVMKLHDFIADDNQRFPALYDKSNQSTNAEVQSETKRMKMTS